MAQLAVTLTLETELITDAVIALERAHRALVHRHGAPFRALERRIEHIAEAMTPGALVALGDGRFVALPPPQVVKLLAEAASLNVI